MAKKNVKKFKEFKSKISKAEQYLVESCGSGPSYSAKELAAMKKKEKEKERSRNKKVKTFLDELGIDENICSNCGEKLKPTAKFCPECGTKVEHPEIKKK